MGRIDEAWKRYSKATSGPAVAATPDPHVRSSALSQYPHERPEATEPDPGAPSLPVFLTRDVRPEPPRRVAAPVASPASYPAAPMPVPVPVAPPPSASVASVPHPVAPAPAHTPPPIVPVAAASAAAAGESDLDPTARIVAALLEAHASSGLRTVMVTGTGTPDDNTGVAITLARSLSESLPRVLLIGLDPESPALQTALGMRLDHVGSDWPHTRWQSLLLCEATPHLSVLTAERPVPPGGFASDRIGAMLDNCSMFDFVVLSTPPVASLPDAAQLARRAGAVVFVLSARALFSVNEKGMTQIGRSAIVGTVLSGVPGEQPDTHTGSKASAPTARIGKPGAR